MKDKFQNWFSDFECRCLTDTWGIHSNAEGIAKLWEKATSKKEFLSMLRSDPETMYTQACGVLSRENFYFIREMVGDRQIKTVSARGCLMIGDENCQFFIPNGYGDGNTRVAVIHPGEKFNFNALSYYTMVSGKINVYYDDCGIPTEDNVVCRLDGEYGIYHGASFVIFEEHG